MQAAALAASPQTDRPPNSCSPSDIQRSSTSAPRSADQRTTGVAAASASMASLRPLPQGMLHLVGECLQALQSVVLVGPVVNSVETQPRLQHAQATATTAAQATLQTGNCRSHSVSDLRDWSWTSNGGDSEVEERGSNGLQQHSLGSAAGGSRSCSNLAAASLLHTQPVVPTPVAAPSPTLAQRIAAAMSQPMGTDCFPSVASSAVLVSSLGTDLLSDSSSDEDSSSSEDSSSEEEDTSSEGEEDSSDDDDEDEVVVGASASHASRLARPPQMANPFAMMTTDESDEEGSSEESEDEDEFEGEQLRLFFDG